jgi:hypothetical protein
MKSIDSNESTHPERKVPKLIEAFRNPKEVKKLGFIPDPRLERFCVICQTSEMTLEHFFKRAKKLLKSEEEVWLNILLTSQREFDWDTLEPAMRYTVTSSFVSELTTAVQEFLDSLKVSHI